MRGPVPGRVRFGSFELDLRSGELCSIGAADTDDKVLLRKQAFQVLRMLIESRGKIVRREEIKNRLWPNDTIVDFDHSINAAIKTLRRALGDSADNPQYIETVPRRGYRLRLAIEWLETKIETPPHEIAGPQSFPGPASLIGKRVAHYRVLEVIGGGGMGMVYKAEDLKLARLVALKFLPEELAVDSVALQRFEREAQSASALNHPNICTVHGIEEDAGQPFIVMELLEGQSLLEYLNTFPAKAIPLVPLLDIAAQVCGALQAAHDKGIIHRDIKPANIFLTKQGRAKILDFGLAKLAVMGEAQEERAESASGACATNSRLLEAVRSSENLDGPAGNLTRTGIAIGTTRYMSPEQVRKEPLDARTDLFSFGLVMYEMAAGRHAFSGSTEAAIQDAIVNRKAPSARDANPAVPRRLDRIVVKALEKDRSQRYQSAAEMLADLKRVQQEMHPVRRRARRFLASSTLLLVAAGMIWTYWEYRSRVTLSPNDTIVLAGMTNHTDDPVLDDAVNAALRVGLEQTPYLNILGADKVFGTLGILGLHLDAKVTPEIARQICLRTNSKMVITSSIADAGNRFQIELSAIGCQNGKAIALIREDVGTRDKIVRELGVATVQLRRKLGEPAESIRQFNQPLDIATSPSPEALQLLAIGYKHHIATDLQGAISYYQRAIQVDSNFALAYSALGAAYVFADLPSLAADAEKKSYDLRDRMTVPGRFQVETGYYEIATGELEKAYADYNKWLKLFPQNMIAGVNIAHCLIALGRPDEALPYQRDTARSLPSSTTYSALMRSYIDLDRLDEAKATFDEARARNIDGIELRLWRARLAFLQNDRPAMQEQWAWAEGKRDGYKFLGGQAKTEAYFGHLVGARRTMKQVAVLADKYDQAGSTLDHAEEALQEAEVGNIAEAQRVARTALAVHQGHPNRFELALACALAGDVVKAQNLVTALSDEFPLDTIAQNYSLPAIRAAIKLHSNDPTGAIEALRPAAQYELSDDLDELNSLWPAYLRGLAYLQIGDGPSAAAEFRKLLDHPGLVGREITGALSHLQLARAQRLSGDDDNALKSYQEFLTLWKDADPDIPVYQQAKAEYSKLLSPRRLTEPATRKKSAAPF